MYTDSLRKPGALRRGSTGYYPDRRNDLESAAVWICSRDPAITLVDIRQMYERVKTAIGEEHIVLHFLDRYRRCDEL